MADPLAPRLPASLLTTQRSDVACTLPVVEGALPAGLGGHFFAVAPASTVAWGGRPRPGQPPLLNGDGMVMRVDFAGGAARARCKLTRPPCAIADELTHHAAFPFSLLQFLDAGIARLSPLLGARDFLNTAFVPFGRAGEPTRLLVTYDAGRPYELDPYTLDVVGPMGAAGEWAAETFAEAPFPMILSSGHPFFDPHSGEVFTCNYGRSLASMGPDPRLLERLGPSFWQGRGGLPEAFTHLVRWDGEGALQHWALVDAAGKPIEVTQSVHQLAVTKSWIVLFDTAFRVGFEQWFNDPLPDSRLTEELLRALLARPQNPYTTVWLVPRAQLGTGSTDPEKPTPVTATTVTIPVESTHLLADYDDDGDRVVLYLAHSAASDLAEWLRPYDHNFYDGSPPRVEAEGMVAIGDMDINRIGRHVVDARAGTLVSSEVLFDDQRTWTLALYAGRELPALSAVPRKLEQLFFTSAGFFPELLSKFVHHLYADHPHRLVPLEQIAAMARQGGRPSALFRVDTASMRIADACVAPPGVIIASPQFVPRTGGGAPSEALDGWLVSTVFTPARAELWIHDAADLAHPVCKLDASALGFGFTLHTAWLPAIAPRTARYRVDIDADVAGRGDDNARKLLDQVRARLAPR